MNAKIAANVKINRRFAEIMHSHARTCKKALSECLTCQRNIATFQEMPPVVLAEVLADQPRIRR